MRFARGYGRTWLLWALAAPLLAVLALSVHPSLTDSPAAPAQALDDQESAFLDLINQYRAGNGLGPLSVNSLLTDTAHWMAQDMAANNYFSHTDSLGRDSFARMDSFGYNYNTWRGENLAAGIDDAQRAMQLWQGSPGHNANMLNPNYTVIGIARAYGPTSTFSWYWATEFGGQGEPPPPQAPPPPPPPLEPAPQPAPYVPPTEPEPAPPQAGQPAPEPVQEATPVVASEPAPAPTTAHSPAEGPQQTPPLLLRAKAAAHPWWHAPRAGWALLRPGNDDARGNFLHVLARLAGILSAARNRSLLSNVSGR